MCSNRSTAALRCCETGSGEIGVGRAAGNRRPPNDDVTTRAPPLSPVARRSESRQRLRRRDRVRFCRVRLHPGLRLAARGTSTPGSSGDRGCGHRLAVQWPDDEVEAPRGGAAVAGLSVVIAIACVAAFVFTHTNDTERLMEEWDGKFAKDVPNCGQGVDASVPVEGLKPDVIGPDGTPIAQIHLRQYSKRECPPAVWAWVPWNGDPDAMLPVPEGWTIHVVIRRDKTSTKVDATESNSGQAVPYPISKILMATPEAGCVAVDVFFTNDAGTAPLTPTATTGCVTAD